jgi:ankyrin repeat protein
MAYQVALSCNFCGLPWSGYVCCEGWQSSQPKDNDIETDVSQYYYPYCESFASSSSFPDLSLSGSAEPTSASSSTSEVDFADFTKQKTADFRAMDPSTSRSGLMAAETTKHSDVNGYIDPRLVVSDLSSYTNPNTSDHMGNATLGGSLVYNDFRPPLVDQVSNLQYPTNDFDIALSEVQPTIHAFKPSLNLWLRTWVATNPQKFPNSQELESLRTLSGLSEAEIVTCLSKYVSTQATSAAEAMDTEPTIRDAEQTSYQKRPPRHRPKCRKSRRRFRYVAETQDKTRIFECTHRCGQSFAKKGQWTRHERSNVEEWKCHRCDFVSSRKDKLRSHLTEAHPLCGGVRKSHCRQLLQPSARRCGFCLEQFEDWSAWLNHISAHFEGHIAGGPWTMDRWNRAVDPDFGSGESDDDDDDDNGDNDDDQAGNEEDQDDPDYDNSATDQTGNPSSKGKDASYGSGPQGSSSSSSKSKSKPSNSCSSKSHRGASRALSYLQQDYYTSQSDRECKLARSHTTSLPKPRKADLVPLDGEGNRGFLRYRKRNWPVVQSQHTCSPKDSNGVAMESISGILAPCERERRQNQPLRLGAVKSNIGYRDAMLGVSALPKVLVIQQNSAAPPSATLPHAAPHRNYRQRQRFQQSPDLAEAEAVAELLLDKEGVDPDSKDHNGRMSLWWAAMKGDEAAAKSLFNKEGVDLDSMDHNGRTPLWWAAENGHEAVVKLLLAQYGVDPDSKDASYGQTPLSWAARNGHEAVFKLLLARDGVDPGSKGHSRRTPLWWAAGNGHEAVVKLLLAQDGVDPDSKNTRYGRTPLSWATISRPISANFHAIQTLYGAKDRRHLAQFKIERFLNELDNDYPRGSILDAPFDSHSRQHEPTCLPDTHVDVLQKISKWVDGKDEGRIFWANGLAGRGKSTIAWKYFERERLGASFFSSDGDIGHAGKFFPNIAMQLANKSPSLNRHICEAVAEWSAITDQSFRDQWRRLILRPLLRLDGNSSPPSFFLIIDALDEYEGENKDSVELSTEVGLTDLIQDDGPPSYEEALQVQRTSSLRRYGVSRSEGKKNNDHDTGTIPPSQQGCETY